MSVVARLLDRLRPAASARGRDPGISPRRIVLHAGLPKTGSTAIQRFLAENRDDLARLGFLVPEAGMSRGHHKHLVLDLVGEANAPQHRGAAEAFGRELSRHPRHTVVASSEYLSQYFARHRGGTPLVDRLLGMGFDVTVVFYVRPQAEQINSAYVQYVKAFATDASIEEFALDRAGRIGERYAHLLAVARPPRVAAVFRPYNAEVRRGGVVRDFLSTIGLPEADRAALGRETRVNEALGPIAIAAARDALSRVRRDGRRFSEQQRRAMQRKLLELVEAAEPEPPFQGIGDALRRAVEERAAENQERFAQAAWGTSWDAVFGFGRDAERPVNAFDPATAEPEAVDRHRLMLDALTAAAAVIVEDEALAEVRPWDVEAAKDRGRAKRPGLNAKP